MSDRFRILYLEDDSGDAELVHQSLCASGLLVDVSIVDNRKSFETALATNGIDLILSDYNLPVFNGEQALALRGSLYPELPFIFVTGELGEERAVELLKSGATDYVLKDRLSRLAPAVRRAIAESRERARLVQAETDLRESERRLKLAQSAGGVGLWDWVADPETVYWSETMWKLYGTEPSDPAIIPDLWHKCLHPDDRERMLHRFAQFRGSGDGEFRDEFRVVRPNGTVCWLECVGRIERDSTGKPVRMSGVNVDVSARKEAELALRQADRRKDEFLATLAHELRNPLAPIRTGLQNLRFVQRDPELFTKITDMMERQVIQLVRLIEDLLDVNRINSGKFELRREKVELSVIIKQAIDTVRPQIQAANQELALTMLPHSVFLNADPVRLTQVFANLLDNACKFSRSGSRIFLHAEIASSDCASAENGSDAGKHNTQLRGNDWAKKESANRVCVRVRDNGIGILRDNLENIFELFVQGEAASDRMRSGLGIGLSLVRKLVQMHGGTVTATSPGIECGSEFIVTLPIARECNVYDCSKDESSENGGLAMRILVVDDNRDVTESLAMLLGFLNHEVRSVYDGESALEAVKSWQPHIAILDIGMAVMNGFEVCRRLRRDYSNRDLITVALTGYGTEADRQRTREAGFDYHLVKPAGIDAIQELLTDVGNRLQIPT
jgi:PAS domain S-box-containing protein